MRAGWVVAGASLVLLVVLYVVALGTDAGLRVDDLALVRGFHDTVHVRAYRASFELLRTIDVATVLFAAVLATLLGLGRRRPDAAAAAVAILALANGTTQLAKPLLARIDPLGGDGSRAMSGSFPSGHATVAMSIVLALLVAAPAELRPLVAVVGAAYAAGVGIALVALGAHFPSDVAGGYLVAGLWAGLVCSWLGRHEHGGFRMRGVLPAGAAVVLGAVAFVVVARGRPELVPYVRAHTSFFASAATLGALALAVAAAASWSLTRGRARARSPG